MRISRIIGGRSSSSYPGKITSELHTYKVVIVVADSATEVKTTFVQNACLCILSHKSIASDLNSLLRSMRGKKLKLLAFKTMLLLYSDFVAI